MGIKQTKRPAIPQSERIKYRLDDLEDAFEGVKRYHGGPPSPEAEEALRDFDEALKKLVRLDNTQLHHPFVQARLSFPRQKDFLASLHSKRRLETKVKRQIKPKEMQILSELHKREEKLRSFLENEKGRIDPTKIALYEREEKRYSLSWVQRSLERKGLIKSMSRQAFHKLAKRLLASGGSKGPFYNPCVLPPKPTRLPKRVKEAWERAEKQLRDLRTTPEAKAKLDEYIESRRRDQARKFLPKIA